MPSNNLEGVRVKVSVANHDPDFDLAKGSHQVAITLRIDSNDLNKEITNTIHSLYGILRNDFKEIKWKKR
jgi:hypothetical protein